ncbi:MAG: hypothetical protein JWQ44_950 [Chthoniobacter sp.]|nr:hypothetical protein [Chthoniobacter sp.]
MKRAKGCLLVAFIFVCGFLVGGFLGAAFGWVGFFHKVVKGGPKAVREIVIERAVHDLGLKQEQQAQVRAIVDETAIELGRATEASRPQVEEIMGRAEERVRLVLNPKQRAKFDSFAEKGRRRWKTPHERLELPKSNQSTPPVPATAEPGSPP